MSTTLKAELHFTIPRWVFYLIFTVSGFSGLIYESIWSHYLKLFLGHAALAQSLVLILFMGGMAIGAWVAARFSEKLASPILIYVAVEAVIGIAGLQFHNIFTWVIDIFYNSLLPDISTPWISSTLKWLSASLLILPQSILLGMTFPLMVAGIIRRFPDSPGASISMLYFTNSIGAALGVLCSGFVLIELVGLPGTILTAGLLNILLALFVWVVLKIDPVPTAAPLERAPREPEHERIVYLFLAVAGLTGAASFIYEISWIRMLSMVLGSTTYAFELMLSAFITGLAFGGLWIKKRIDRIESPIKFLGGVQIVMGVMALLTVPVYVESYDWMKMLVQSLQKNEQGYDLFTAGSHLIALSVMLPTTFCAGMTLPLLTHILLKKRTGEKSIGQIYSANTVGAIIGVLFAIHVGLPALGLKLTVVLGAGIDIVLGIFLISRTVNFKKSISAVSAVAASCFVLAYVAFVFPLPASLLASGVYRVGDIDTQTSAQRDVVFHRDGKTASITVYSTPLGLNIITTNGKPDASINMMTNPDYLHPTADEVTMVLAGALGFAYHSDATRVANVGLGSGLTTHTLLAKESLELVETVEIEESMVLGSKIFGRFVERTHTDPRSVIHVDDAKTFFSTRNRKYDIIITEPSNPWVSGVSSLFSDEFYQTITNYIDDDGLFIQWIQMYEFDNQLLMSIINAIDKNFSDFAIYNTDSVNILLVLKKEGRLPEPDWSRVFTGQLEDDLEKQQIESKEDMLIRLVGKKENLQDISYFYPTSINSDYFPYVDINAPRARYKRTSSDIFTSWSLAPIPLLEMLNGYTVEFGEVSNHRHHIRSQKAYLVSQAHKYLASSSLAKDLELHSETRRSLSLVHLVSKTCTHSQHGSAWQSALFDLAFDTLPFLNIEDASFVVDSIRGSCPESALTTSQLTTLSFLSALANRDSKALMRTGRELLILDRENIDPKSKNIILSATLLGYIVEKRFKEAEEFFLDIRKQDRDIDYGYGTVPYQQLILATIVRELEPGSAAPQQEARR